MAAPKPRVKTPASARPGEPFTVKALISHPMESGLRRDTAGRLVPRKIVNAFSCAFNGRPVFSATLGTGMAANPYFEFSARIDEAGSFTFTWVDDDGTVYTHQEPIALDR